MNNNLEIMKDDICDQDVASAIKDMKLNLNLSAEVLGKIYSCACRHARARAASATCVRAAMSRNVLSVNKFEDITRAVNILAENNISGLPVVDRENHVVGIISEADVVSMVGSRRPHTFKDLLRHVLGHPIPERKMGHIVGDIMTSPVVTIHPDTEISEAVRLMDERKVRRLPVVDKEQRLIGLISRSDIVKTMGERLSA
ncbi:MAG: CBS domain-containing protein [Nitrospirae bacterium]|nr:CBS domain-containing protein [Nitrospirota bacterium]